MRWAPGQNPAVVQPTTIPVVVPPPVVGPSQPPPNPVVNPNTGLPPSSQLPNAVKNGTLPSGRVIPAIANPTSIDRTAANRWYNDIAPRMDVETLDTMDQLKAKFKFNTSLGMTDQGQNLIGRHGFGAKEGEILCEWIKAQSIPIRANLLHYLFNYYGLFGGHELVERVPAANHAEPFHKRQCGEVKWNSASNKLHSHDDAYLFLDVRDDSDPYRRNVINGKDYFIVTVGLTITNDMSAVRVRDNVRIRWHQWADGSGQVPALVTLAYVPLSWIQNSYRGGGN